MSSPNGKKILSAHSSLTNFSIELEDDLGLRIDAMPGPSIAQAVVSAEALPQQKDAVCSVDWNWIFGSVIKDVKHEQSAVLRLVLEPAGTITVTASNWQGSAFLGFQPYKPN